MKYPAIVTVCVLASWTTGTISARQPPASSTAIASSPEAQRVLASYAELMDAVQESVAVSGGSPTERMRAIEERMAGDVRVAAPELLRITSQGGFPESDAAAYALRFAPEPAVAVEALLAALDRFDGRLTNNICLSLEKIVADNPTVDVPVERIAQALGAPRWNYQQKAAQVLAALARRGTLADPEGTVGMALVPMLASQRPRVFRPAQELLPKVSGQSLGDDPQPWAQLYAARFGRAISMADGVYELVQIVHPTTSGGREAYRVEGQTYGSEGELLARLNEDAGAARELGRRFAVVIQLGDEGFPPDRIEPLADAILPLTSDDLVVSPPGDQFVPFSVAAHRLRGYLKFVP
jgi:hypothetical protein